MKKLAVLLLAAGYSRRFGPKNKLLSPLGEQSVLAHTLQNLAGVAALQKLAVVNSESTEVGAECAEAGFDIITNRNAARGMGASLAAGAHALGDVDGVMTTLADMPFIQPSTLARLIKSFDAAPRRAIVAPVFGQQRGHPVILSSDFFGAIKGLNEDKGARDIIKKNRSALITVQVSDSGVIRDIDLPSDL